MGRVGDLGRGLTKPVAERVPSTLGFGLAGCAAEAVLVGMGCGFVFDALLVVGRAKVGSC
jgi:hypothetical protein